MGGLAVALLVGGFYSPAQAASPSRDDLHINSATPRLSETKRLNALTATTKPRAGDRLGQRDRVALGRARAAGKGSVVALVATTPGAVPAVARQLTGMGANIRYRNQKLGYLRAVVPVSAVERTAKLRGVYGVDLNEAVAIPDPRPNRSSDQAPATSQAAAPGAKTPAVNPYLPTHEIGAPQFVRQHPQWDGRGVTIGVLDTGVDLDHPALRTTSTGERKIVDWVTATDPVTDEDPTWRPMLTAVKGPRFTYAGRTYKAPPGDLSVNQFVESKTKGSEYGGDVNRDGDTTDSWGVLYRKSDHAVWVDTNQNGDFTDEVLMHPYRDQFQVGHLGRDNPATAEQESVPFVVEYRDDVDLTPAGLPGRTADFVNLGIVSGFHGSHVAGIAAGQRLFGGAMSGAAPGAKLVSSRACLFLDGCTSAALLEGMIDLVVNRHVDVVNMSIGGLPALNDGQDVRSQVYNRLIADYGVQLFISDGNEGPGINTTGDPATATDVVSVAASVSSATFLANYGARVSAGQALFNFSSRGPREDGGVKPNLSAPGAAVSSTPRYLPNSSVPQAGYALPAGYSMLNGTSMASPEAAGGAALLLSASKATEVPVTSAQLRAAIYSSARFDRSLPTVAQGVGRLQVGGAWSLLRKDARLVPGRYDVSAPVCSPLSSYLVTPNRGAGIYNRCAATAGGQRAGQTRSYSVTIVRHSGRAGARRHSLRWVGNDATFTAPRSVVLPRGKAVKISITARAGAGAHSAILKVDDGGTVGTDAYVSAVVVVGSELKAPSFARTVSGRVERLRTVSYFVTVPQGAPVLKVSLSGLAPGSQTRFLAFHPYGVGVEDNSSPNCYSNYPVGQKCNPLVRSYAKPLPGVWEISVEARRTTPWQRNPYSLTMSVLGVSVQPELTTVASARIGRPVPLSWSLVNRFAPLTVTPEGGDLGSARRARPTIGQGSIDRYRVDVPSGVSRFDAAINNTSDAKADLDLAVLRDGVVVAQSADGDSDESVSIVKPTRGSYVVEVSGYSVPAKTTTYDYRDVYFAPSLGSLEVPSTPIALANQGRAKLSGSLTAAARPATGRQLFGEVSLLESEDQVVGRAEVLVAKVTSDAADPLDPSQVVKKGGGRSG